MPRDTNPAGDIFGGWLMSQMDLAAGPSPPAMRTAGARRSASTRWRFTAPRPRRRRGVALRLVDRGGPHVDDDPGRGLASRLRTGEEHRADRGGVRVRGTGRNGSPSAGAAARLVNPDRGRSRDKPGNGDVTDNSGPGPTWRNLAALFAQHS